MSYNWLGFLDLAKELATSDDESRCRTCISRAYYSAFHVALDWILSKDPKLRLSVPKDGKVHQFVIDRFNNSKRPEALSVAFKLRNLRQSRTQADYDSSSPVRNPDARTSLAIATKLVESLEKVPFP